MSRFTRWILAAVLTLLAVGLAPRAAEAQPNMPAPGDPARLEELMGLIGREYFRPIAGDSLRLAAQSVLAGTLDPYSRVFDPAGWQDVNVLNSGTRAGVGVRVEADGASASFRVTGVVANSPALRAGLRVGDVLVALDGRSVAGRSLDDVLGAMGGTEGSTVRLTVRRPGVRADVAASMRRRLLKTPTVRGLRRAADGSWSYFADAGHHVGYIRIEHFTTGTPADLDRALAAVRREGGTSLILDIRVNPGGLVDAAVAVADRFLESGTLFTFQWRDSLQVIRAHAGGDEKLPLVLLVDGYTQSVAELLAASLQDNRRAVVIGARSWGKGHGQRLFAFRDGRGGLKLTGFTFVRPSGRPMERHFADQDSTQGGVWPDSGMAVSLSAHEYDEWLEGLFALDDLMPLAAGQASAPMPAEDRALAAAVAVLLRRTAH